MNIVDLVKILSFAIASISMLMAAFALRKSTKIAQGNFLLKIDEMANRYNEIYYPLRDRFDGDKGQPYESYSEAEILEIKEYMGFLEHSERLIASGSITINDFDDLFGHRVRALTYNTEIMNATVLIEPKRWKQFIRLMRRLRTQVSEFKTACFGFF